MAEERRATPLILLPSPRRMGWCEVTELVCPMGHRIKRDAFVFTDGAVRCKARPGQQECGKLLYLIAAIPARSPDKEPTLLFFAEVERHELRAIEALGLGPVDVLRRLGAMFPGPMRSTGPITPDEENG